MRGFRSHSSLYYEGAKKNRLVPRAQSGLTEVKITETVKQKVHLTLTLLPCTNVTTEDKSKMPALVNIKRKNQQ